MSGQGYFYPSGAANAPMPGGMFPGGGAAAAGYATIGAGGMMPPGAGLGMQAGAQGQGSSRYPSFTPMASPSNAANGGVNGSAAQMGPTSPYPAYQHAASASPSLASDSLTTATTTPVPMNGSAGPNSRPNGMSMPSYGMEQNPYAHLHQQHANHPHLNPYANMPYANGNPYQPYAPIHQQLAAPISPAMIHAQAHPPPTVTPKMNTRPTYGYPVLPNTTPVANPARKPVSIASPRLSVSEGTAGGQLNGHIADERESSDEEEAVGSDSEPVFASINQAVAQKAKKSKRKASTEERTVSVPDGTPQEVSRTTEPEPAEKKSSVVPQPMTDSFMDAADSATNDLVNPGARPPPWVSSARPYPVETAPGVVFHRKTPFPARLYPEINTWEHVEQRGRSGGAKEEKKRQQDKAVVLRQRRKVEDGAERTFGEVTKEVMAQVVKEVEERDAQRKQEQQRAEAEQTSAEVISEAEKPQERACQTAQVAESSAPTETTSGAETISEKAATEAKPVTADAPTTEAPSSDTKPPQPTSAAPTVSEQSPTPAPAPVKAAPKSWAALLRTAAPKQTPSPSPAVSSSAGTVPPSNVTSPRLAQAAIVEDVAGSSDSQPLQKAIVVPEGAPAAPTPVVPAKPINAWGSRPMIVPDQLDLGKLLAEGLDERTRASLKKVTSVPRGLINTGNMCFANSVSLPSGVLKCCSFFSADFASVGLLRAVCVVAGGTRQAIHRRPRQAYSVDRGNVSRPRCSRTNANPHLVSSFCESLQRPILARQQYQHPPPNPLPARNNGPRAVNSSGNLLFRHLCTKP